MAGRPREPAIPTTDKIDFSKSIDGSVLKDQNVLITGGASGIGEGYTNALAAAGAYVTVLDLQGDQGRAKVQALVDKGYKVQFVQGDVRSWDDQVRAFDAAVAFSPHRSLDIVIPVAGITGKNIQEWLDNPTTPDGKLVAPDTRCIDINLTAVWHTAHLALHHFRKSVKSETRSVPTKQIVFVSSLAGYTAHSLISDYAGSKWGVRGVWRSIRDLRNILGPDTPVKFRTSLIAPWFVRTSLTEKFAPGMEAMGIKFASMEQCVDGLMRIVCDEDVKGRAVAIGPGVCVDLCDDFEGYEGGREWPGRMLDGTFGDYKTIHAFFSARLKSKTLGVEEKQ